MRTGIIEPEINGMWQVVHDSGELLSAVTTYSITGLKGDTDIEYQLIVRGVNDYAGATDYGVTFNSDTGSNYGYQEIKGNDSTASASRNTSVTSISIGRANAANELFFSKTHIFAKSGKERTILTMKTQDISETTVSTIIKRGNIWNNTVDEITLITITGSTNALGVGTRIILLKKVHNDIMKTGVLTPNKIEGTWERIYSNTITSATSSFSITGLEGNTDEVYKLITRIVNDESTPTYKMYFTSDTTNTNYGRQQLQPLSGSVAAASSIYLFMGYATATGQISHNEIFIYAKSGYVRTCLINIVGQLSGTTIPRLHLAGVTWNNTSSEFTSMDLTCNTAGGFGVGTVIELYRLNL